MHRISNILSAAVLTLVVALLLLQSVGHDRATPSPTYSGNSKPATEQRLKDGDVVPGKYIVKYREAQDSQVFKRNHEDLARGLQARGVRAKILRRLDSSVFHGAVVRLAEADNDMHVHHLRSLSHVQDIEAVRTIVDDSAQEMGTWASAVGGSSPDEYASTYATSILERNPDPLPNIRQERIDFQHRKTGVYAAFSENIRGQNIKIALIDDGVDFGHPDLGGCFGQGCRISFGKNLVPEEDDEDSGDDAWSNFSLYSVSNEEGQPDAVPQTTETLEVDGSTPLGSCRNVGGTISAGVLVGQNPRIPYHGVATEAELGVYRIFDCSGRSSSERLIEAIGLAVNAGAKIILFAADYLAEPNEANMVRDVLAGAVAQNVTVVMGAGQSIQRRLFETEYIADVPGVITVASAAPKTMYGMHQYMVAKTKWAPGHSEPHRSNPMDRSDVPRNDDIEMQDMPKESDISVFITSSMSIRSGWYRIVFALESGVDLAAVCADDFIFPTLGDNEILVVPSINCVHKAQFYERMQGLVDRLIYSAYSYTKDRSEEWDTGVPYRAYVDETDSVKWRADGAWIWLTDAMAQIVEASVTIHEDEKANFRWDIPKGTRLGPSRNLGLHPTIAAPGSKGVLVLPLRYGGYAFSDPDAPAAPRLAAAYAAGCAALLLQAQPGLTPVQVAQSLMGSSELAVARGGTLDEDASDEPDPWGLSMVKQGAGVVQVYNAIKGTRAARDKSKLFITTSPPALLFGDTDTGEKLQKLTICSNIDTPDEVEFRLLQTKVSTVYALDEYGRPSSRGWGRERETVVEEEFTVDLELSTRDFALATGSCKTVEVSLPQTLFPNKKVVEGRYPVYSGRVNISTSHGTLAVPFMGVAANMSNLVPYGEVTVVDEYENEVNDNDLITFPSTQTASGETFCLQTNLLFSAIRLLVEVVPVGDGVPDFRTKTSIGQKVIATIYDGTYVPITYVGSMCWTGFANDGGRAPPGKYRFLLRAQRSTRDASNPDNYFSTLSSSFNIEFAT